ncbi:MAG: ferritin [Thermoplasmatota archaeon]
MLKENIEEAINEQINAELYSAYLYLAMAADFAEKGLDGFKHWMRLQADEEVEHAMRFFDYLNSRGGRVKLSAVDKPKNEWESSIEAFEDAYEHEQKVTRMINDLADLAEKEKDRATLNMLQWFIDEQVEEEESAEEIVTKLRMIGDNVSGLMMLDSKLGERE